jgi:sporulation protein YlmC with PRC-barrel domain
MRLDTLRKRVVVDPETGTRLGTVTDYWVDAAAGRVAMLIIRPVDAELSQRVAADRVAHVGRDAVILSRSTGSGTGTPVRTDWLDRRQIRRLIVYTDSGKRLGRIDRAEVDHTLRIQNFDLAAPLWRRWLWMRQHIAAAAVAWCGKDVMVVRTDELIKLRPVGKEDGVYASLGDLTVPDAPAPPPRERVNSALPTS